MLPPSKFCKGWLLPPSRSQGPPQHAAVERALAEDDGAIHSAPTTQKQCLEQQWRFGSIWGTIGQQHGVLRQLTLPNVSCSPADCREACCNDPDCVEFDQGSVQGCVDHWNSVTLCELLFEDDCVATVYPGTEPAGCP